MEQALHVHPSQTPLNTEIICVIPKLSQTLEREALVEGVPARGGSLKVTSNPLFYDYLIISTAGEEISALP